MKSSWPHSKMLHFKVESASQEFDGWLCAPIPTIPKFLNRLAQKNGDARRVYDVQPAQGGCQ